MLPGISLKFTSPLTPKVSAEAEAKQDTSRARRFEYAAAYCSQRMDGSWSLGERADTNGRRVMDNATWMAQVEYEADDDDDDPDSRDTNVLLLERGFEWYHAVIAPLATLCLVAEFSWSGQDTPIYTVYTGVVLLDEALRAALRDALARHTGVPDHSGPAGDACVAHVWDYLAALSASDVAAVAERGLFAKPIPTLAARYVLDNRPGL